jgi:hypothetical protein
MKSLIKAVAAAAVVVAPAFAFAQSNSEVTRPRVQQDLQRVEAAGYNPSVNDNTTYPADAHAAEHRAYGRDGSYGGTANGTSASGMRAMPSMNSYDRPMRSDGAKPVYFGH